MTFDEMMKQLNLKWRTIESFEDWEFDFIFMRCRELDVKLGFDNLKKLVQLKNRKKVNIVKNNNIGIIRELQIDNEKYLIKRYSTGGYFIKKENEKKYKRISIKNIIKLSEKIKN